MRIVIVSQGNNASGAEIVTAELYSELKDNVTVLSGSKPILNYFASKRFRVKKIDGLAPLNRASIKLGKLIKLIISLFRIRKEVKRIHPDYIHVYNLASLLYITIALFNKKVPVLLHVHDFYSKDKMLTKVAVLLKNKPTKIVAVSNSVRLDLINIGFPTSKIRCIHNGIEAADDYVNRVIHSEKLTIGFVGAINEWKGLHILMEAACFLDKKGYALNYVIVGSFFSENYKRRVKLISEKVKFSNIKFLGARKDARNLMKQFDILVHCSIEDDPFPTVLLEAMHAGCAVVGSNCGGVPEIIDDHKTGLLHESGSPESLSNALEELLLNSELREKVAKNGLIKAKKYLTVSRYRKDFFEFLKPIFTNEEL